ncbi:hypothetical protein H8D85_01850 [bacterium]|nr:hypothetical protein [bacterium]
MVSDESLKKEITELIIEIETTRGSYYKYKKDKEDLYTIPDKFENNESD